MTSHDYLIFLQKQCILPEKIGILEKIKDENIKFNSNNCEDLIKYNFSAAQLKTLAKTYKIFSTGSKAVLLARIYNYLKLSFSVIKIQKVIKRYLRKQIIESRGPAYLNRSLCVNDRDFLTDDEVDKIEDKQFFSFMDVDNFVYGFDIISLYNLILKSDGDVKNPYNRNIINSTIIQKLQTLIKTNKQITIKIPVVESTPEKKIEFRIIELFQTINSLGNYSDSSWFTHLNRSQLIRFMRELADIWYYRSQMSIEVRKAICPPHGDPFRTFHFSYIQNEYNIHKVQKYILEILEKIINSGVNRENKALGSYYVLGALTLVSENAATSIPWLFHSFSFN